jgi:hypothetical protein
VIGQHRVDAFLLGYDSLDQLDGVLVDGRVVQLTTSGQRAAGAESLELGLEEDVERALAGLRAG